MYKRKIFIVIPYNKRHQFRRKSVIFKDILANSSFINLLSPMSLASLLWTVHRKYGCCSICIQFWVLRYIKNGFTSLAALEALYQKSISSGLLRQNFVLTNVYVTPCQMECSYTQTFVRSRNFWVSLAFKWPYAQNFLHSNLHMTRFLCVANQNS